MRVSGHGIGERERLLDLAQTLAAAASYCYYNLSLLRRKHLPHIVGGGGVVHIGVWVWVRQTPAAAVVLFVKFFGCRRTRRVRFVTRHTPPPTPTEGFYLLGWDLFGQVQ